MKSKNKLVWEIDLKYYTTLKIICQQSLRRFGSLPLEWEDIYYQFLFTVDKLIAKYNPELGVPFKTFLGLQCKYFAMNICRKYNTNKFKTLNRYLPLDETISNRIEDFEPVVDSKIDTSVFTKVELDIFNFYFLEGLNITKSAAKVGATAYRTKKIISHVKSKILIQIKN